MSLEKERKAIDRIDGKILKLLEERMGASARIAEIKKAEGLKITDSGREKEILEKIESMSSPDFADGNKQVWKAIIKASKDHQKKLMETD